VEGVRQYFFCVTAILGIGAIDIQPSRAALVPPGFLDCVVALGETLSEADPRNPTAKTSAPQKVWFTEGTGFFYGYLTVENRDYRRVGARSWRVSAQIN
jgi:hypothetical protein